MLNAKGFILGLFIVLMGLGACVTKTAVPATTSPTQAPVVTEMSTAVASQPTLPPSTATPAPKATSTPSITPTETFMETPTETDAIQTATPMNTAKPTVYPDWISAPDANILLLRKSKSSNSMLFNVDTGEWHNIRMNIGDFDPWWLWLGNRFFLSPRGPSPSQKVLDITTGKFVNLPDVDPHRDTLSPDGRYMARIATQEDRSQFMTIVDQESGAETELYNPFFHYKTLNETFIESAIAHWSPDGAFLSVLYDKHYYSDNSDHNLVIYTPSGEIFRQYTNVSISWSDPWNPVYPNKFLITRSYSKSPCVLDVVENQKTCLDVLDAWAESQNVWLYHHFWSPDGDKISYVYQNGDEIKTGLCYFELATENVVCPITADDLRFDEQLWVRIQYWSPDGKYLVLFFNRMGATDSPRPLKAAVVSIDDHSFHILEGEYSWPNGNPWRPPIPSQTDE